MHDMPPLVDARDPVTTYTFSTEMTPASFHPQSVTPIPNPTFASSAPVAGPDTSSSATFAISTLPGSFAPEEDSTNPSSSMHSTSTHIRTSHGKKRDASYIPRPPNAFILFRSSFIRSQRVPGNVEGNHSTL